MARQGMMTHLAAIWQSRQATGQPATPQLQPALDALRRPLPLQPSCDQPTPVLSGHRCKRQREAHGAGERRGRRLGAGTGTTRRCPSARAIAQSARPAGASEATTLLAGFSAALTCLHSPGSRAPRAPVRTLLHRSQGRDIRLASWLLAAWLLATDRTLACTATEAMT